MNAKTPVYMLYLRELNAQCGPQIVECVRKLSTSEKTTMPNVSASKNSVSKQYISHAVVQAWNRYLSVTTIPGLQNIHHASSRLSYSIWCILFLVGLACTIRDVYTTATEYFTYPVITSMSMDRVMALQFPLVTVCNLNRIRCKNLRKLAAQHWGTELGTRLLELHTLTNCHLDFSWEPHPHHKKKSREKWGKYASFLAKNTRYSENYEAKFDDFVTTPDEESVLYTKSDDNESMTEATPRTSKKVVSQTQSFNDLMNFMALYTNLSSEIKKELGHEFKDFIRSCTFNGRSCLNESLYFNHVINSAFGNCYTFSIDRKTIIPGRDYGLSMELYLDQNNYLGAGLSPQAGARLVVHSAGHQPLPEENGITVPPHVAANIALLEVRVKRLKFPYTTNCSSSWDHTWYEARVNGVYAYSLEQCQRICLQLAFEEKCNCSHPSYMDLPTGFIPCNLTSNSQAYVCATDILEEFENQDRVCSCNMDCSEISYETRISSAKWPTDNYWCNIANKYSLIEECDVADNEYGGAVHQEQKLKVQNNLLKIDIYFENLRVKSIEQSPTYKMQTFIGSLGGALSLYLGITLLMLVEALEAVFNLIYSCCLYCQHKISTHSKLRVTRLTKEKKQKISKKLPQPVFFTGRFTPPHQPIIRPRYVW